MYKRLGIITPNHNKLEGRLQRQLAASHFIENLAQGTRIINIDESVLRNTDERRYGWVGVRVKNFTSLSQRLTQTNMIACSSSSGECFFTINKGKTNSVTFSYFIMKLVRHLDG